MVFELLSAVPPSASPRLWLEGKNLFDEKATTQEETVKGALRNLTAPGSSLGWPPTLVQNQSSYLSLLRNWYCECRHTQLAIREL